MSADRMGRRAPVAGSTGGIGAAIAVGFTGVTVNRGLPAPGSACMLGHLITPQQASATTSAAPRVDAGVVRAIP